MAGDPQSYDRRATPQAVFFMIPVPQPLMQRARDQDHEMGGMEL